tara:strand:- start:319 stop:879 length:561 start_codon:yes stop_codon:yes gene_type:complete
VNTNYLYENYKDFEENCYELFTRQASQFLYCPKNIARLNVSTGYFVKIDQEGFVLTTTMRAMPDTYWFTVCQIILLENYNRFKQLELYYYMMQKINLFPNQNKYKDELNELFENFRNIKSNYLNTHYPVSKLAAFTLHDKERFQFHLKEALLIKTKAKTNSEATYEQNQIINYLSSNMHASDHISI